MRRPIDERGIPAVRGAQAPCQLPEEARVAAAKLVKFLSGDKLLEGVLPRRLEKPEPVARSAVEEAVVEQRLEVRDVRAGHGFCRFDGEAAGEDSEACERRLRGRREQAVAPVEGGAEGLLSRGGVAGAADEQR